MLLVATELKGDYQVKQKKTLQKVYFYQEKAKKQRNRKIKQQKL